MDGGFNRRAQWTGLAAAYGLGAAAALAGVWWLWNADAFRASPVRSALVLGSILALPAAVAAAWILRRRGRTDGGAQDELERLRITNDELRDILHAASHDLRTPLVNIQGFSRHVQSACGQAAGLVENGRDADELRREALPLLRRRIPEYLHFIATSAERMDAIINGLMGVSGIGSRPFRPTLLPMNDLIGSVIETMAHQIRQAGADVVSAELPDCLGERVQVSRLFSNLIENALKYREPARALQVRIEGRIDNGMAVYSVEDNGVGIKPELQGAIWEQYARLDPEGSPAGNGLGLATVRRIARRHGGQAWVESSAGRGSRFFVSLPGGKR